MRVDRDAIVRVAQEWVGTPFKEQKSVKQVGCDCMGLVVGVARDLGRPEDAPHWTYKMSFRAAELRKGLIANFDRVDEAQPGDILLLRIGQHRKPIHLAIYAGDGRMIHTYGQGPGRVIEVPMGKIWWGALDSVWTWRRHDD